MSALAFSFVALLLVGPVPDLLARASWPQRAPRAAIVLWQSIAIAAVLSAFSAGIAVASRLFAPGPDGKPTTTATSEISVSGLAAVDHACRGFRADPRRQGAPPSPSSRSPSRPGAGAPTTG